jgi:WXG100 family type VII secretion target
MSELRVNPSEVHQSGVEIEAIVSSVKSALTSSDTEIASAQSGWIGKSSDALASIAAEWQQTMQQIVDILADHGSKFTAAAEQYGQTDESGADSVRRAAEEF